MTITGLVKMEFFWVPPEPVSSPSTGTRPAGWEPLLYLTRSNILTFVTSIFKADPVFMPHSMGREEFLVSEVGKIYLGSHNLVQGRPWVYGQARDTVLPAVVHILDTLGKMKPSHRGDPIRVAREISKIVSRNDDT